jgi:hypothetical protein
MLGEIEWLYSRIVGRCPALPKVRNGSFADVRVTSALPPKADIHHEVLHVRKVPIAPVASMQFFPNTGI